MFEKIKSKYQKYQSEKEDKRIEQKKQRKIKERNQKILKTAKIISISICAVLIAFFYLKNPDDFKSFVEDNFILLSVPIWIYLIMLLVLESIRAMFEIIFLGIAFYFFGVFAFLIVAVVTFVIEEIFVEIGSELISGLFS